MTYQTQNNTLTKMNNDISPNTYEKGTLMYERDRKRVTELFRKNTLSIDVDENDEDSLLGNFEPDWTKFESVFATGKWGNQLA